MGHRALHLLVDEPLPSLLPVGAIFPDDRDDPRSALVELQATAARYHLRQVVAPDPESAYLALANMRPDIVLVCGWYKVIPLWRFGGIPFYGFHAGPLPRYRGGAPVVWQIINGEREIGLTLFRLAETIDGGDIVAQGAVSLASNETVLNAAERLEHLAAAVLRAYLPRIIDGTVVLRPQDHSRATSYPQRLPEDGEIDLSWPCARVHDFVRAQTAPYPGAFIRLPDGRTLRVWRTESLPSEHGEAGLVLQTARGPTVGCGDGSVRILAASIDGEMTRPVTELLRDVRSLSMIGAAATPRGRA